MGFFNGMGMGQMTPSVADIAAVTRNNNGYGMNGFGEGWWVSASTLSSQDQ